MNNNPFKKELGYLIFFVLLASICGVVTSYWSLSFLVWTLVYVLWEWTGLFYFYQWYKNGADKEKIPQNHGIWKELASRVIDNKNRNEKIKKNNQHLLNQFDAMAQAMPYATVLLNNRFEIVWANYTASQLLNIVYNKDKNERIDHVMRDPSFIRLLSEKQQVSEVSILNPNDVNGDVNSGIKGRIHIKLVKLSNQRYLLIARDISQQDVLRKSRKAFVDNASHELRTPLTVIMGYLEMMQNAQDIPQSWQHALGQAQLQSGRMENIINDMLKLSSIENERYMEDTDDIVKMPQLLNRLHNDIKNSSIAKKHRFSANIDSSLKIKGNEDELTSICLNLINNAVIHTKPNTQVSLRWFKKNNDAHLWVCDDGDGIEAKHLPHLSERFYRVDNSREKNTNSTGLGLAIVKQICENHNATLDIESKIGTGTCFKIIFPASRIV